MKIKMGMLCMGVLWLASCTQQEMYRSDDVIRLDAGRCEVSRAASEGLEYLSERGTQVGIYGVVTTKTDAKTLLGEEWTENPLMANVQTKKIDPTSGAISWAGTYHYPQETASQMKFCAYHPYAAVGTQGANYVSVAAGRAPRLHFTLTGEEDVMFADPVMGSRVKAAPALAFNHVLTQFNFQMVNGDGFFTLKVKTIGFKGVNTRSSMDVETGALGAWDTLSDDLSVVSFDAPQFVSGTMEKPQLVGRKMMLQPGLPSFTMFVTYDGGVSKEVVIKPQEDETFEAGKSYLITLKMSGKLEITATASVAPWEAGPSGSGVLE